VGGGLRAAGGEHDLGGAGARLQPRGLARAVSQRDVRAVLPCARARAAARLARSTGDRGAGGALPRAGGGDSGMSAARARAGPGGMDVLSVLGPNVRPLRERKPPWFKVQPPGGERYRGLLELIRAENLHTVCQEAACPNVGECWQRGTATFMILG